MGGSGGRYDDAEYSIHGPGEDATAEESEEALAGFTAAWALFRHVLPGDGFDDPSSNAARRRRRGASARPARGLAPERRRASLLDRPDRASARTSAPRR